MKRTKRITLFVLLMILVCSLTACLCACSGGSNGKNGKDGANGKSAYEIWIDEGHSGTQSDFLNWLKGKDGMDGSGGSGSDGKNGQDGKSAYQIWLDNGHTGSETDFLTWLKGEDGNDGQKGDKGAQSEKGETGADGKDGVNGLSAYEIFLKYNSDYTGTEEQWINGLVNNQLTRYTITFKSEVLQEDIVKTCFYGLDLTDIPTVPEKEGQTSANWDKTDFKNITADMTVNAVYDMRKYVTFHNDYSDDEDIKITVNYGEAITDIPVITEKIGNNSKWSVSDFSRITQDMQVNANYETRGLQYSYINQQTQYKVSKGEMDVNTEELFIPAEHDGKSVTVIAEDAFLGCENLLTIYIPDTILEIRNRAFGSCYGLKNINISDSVTNVVGLIFEGVYHAWNINYKGDIVSWCENSKVTSQLMSNGAETLLINGKEISGDLIIPNGVTHISSYAFNRTGITSISIPQSVTSMGFCAFSNCYNLTIVNIPDSITYISQSVFWNCDNLTSVIISNNVTEVSNGAFSYCTKLEFVYFKGTQTQFSQMSISDGNTEFTDATVYYYSETKPTADGFYWHYDTDGVTPVIWEKEN